MEFHVGDKVEKEHYQEAIAWCTQNNCVIEKRDDGFYIASYVAPKPTLEEQVIELEHKYSMCRWQREFILSDTFEFSDYTKNKAQEIEDLAKELRND